MDKKKLIEIKELKKHFKLEGSQILKAVDGVTFDIYEGETLGVVGESGCGKTTLGRTLTVLYNKTSGEILYKGKNVNEISTKEFTKKVELFTWEKTDKVNDVKKLFKLK